jgi:hypothetical protein
MQSLDCFSILKQINIPADASMHVCSARRNTAQGRTFGPMATQKAHRRSDETVGEWGAALQILRSELFHLTSAAI